MAQSLIQLPKDAQFSIAGWDITIEDHMITNNYGLFGTIINMINSSNSNEKTLVEFEGYKISFECVIEECARELEQDTMILAWFIFKEYAVTDLNEQIVRFVKSEAGRIIAGQFVEKIRSCDDWSELYDEMQHKSRFQQDMRNRIIGELEQCRKV